MNYLIKIIPIPNKWYNVSGMYFISYFGMNGYLHFSSMSTFVDKITTFSFFVRIFVSRNGKMSARKFSNVRVTPRGSKRVQLRTGVMHAQIGEGSCGFLILNSTFPPDFLFEVLGKNRVPNLPCSNISRIIPFFFPYPISFPMNDHESHGNQS